MAREFVELVFCYNSKFDLRAVRVIRNSEMLRRGHTLIICTNVANTPMCGSIYQPKTYTTYTFCRVWTNETKPRICGHGYFFHFTRDDKFLPCTENHEVSVLVLVNISAIISSLATALLERRSLSFSSRHSSLKLIVTDLNTETPLLPTFTQCLPASKHDCLTCFLKHNEELRS